MTFFRFGNLNLRNLNLHLPRASILGWGIHPTDMSNCGGHTPKIARFEAGDASISQNHQFGYSCWGDFTTHRFDGGFQMFFCFSSQPGDMIRFDEHIFQMCWKLKPPTSQIWWCFCLGHSSSGQELRYFLTVLKAQWPSVNGGWWKWSYVNVYNVQYYNIQIHNIYIYIYMNVIICTCVFMYICISTGVYIYMYMCVWLYVYMWKC